jgi:hypothetical protein
MSRIVCGRSLLNSLIRSCLTYALAVAWFSPVEGGLIIKPTFDSSITSNANSAQIQATINSVISLYESKFSDNITVPITFQNMTSGLGQSSKPIYYVSTQTYLSALRADSTTANDTTALAHLPTGSTDPVKHLTYMFVAQANLRALGFNMGTSSDGTIGINTSLTNLNRTSINSSKYDLYAVVAHEIDEILGLGSGLNIPSQYGGYIMPQDLFRYGSTSGQRSYTTSSTALTYFSIDGTSHIVQFNQDSRGDYGDWYSIGTHTPRVQDAFGTPGVVINPGTAEFTGIDVIGYNLATSTTTATTPALAGSATATKSSFVVSNLGLLFVELDPSSETPVRVAVRNIMHDGFHHSSP